MRKYNPLAPLVARKGMKPIAIAFNSQFNVEVYEVTDDYVTMAYIGNKVKRYHIQYTPFEKPFVVWNLTHILLSSFRTLTK